MTKPMVKSKLLTISLAVGLMFVSGRGRATPPAAPGAMEDSVAMPRLSEHQYPAPVSTPFMPTDDASVQIAGPVLMVSDLDRSIKFYIDGLGLQVASRLTGNPGPGALVTGRGRRPTPFILLRQRAGEAQATPRLIVGDGLSRIMLSVPDASAAAFRLRAAGFDVPALDGRHIFFVTDPDGYRYEIMQNNSQR